MRNSKTIILLLCGIVFGLAAFPVFAQKEQPVSEIIVNRLPIKDFAESLQAKIQKSEIDLDKSFKVVLEGVLTNDGKLDRKTSKFTVSEGDEKMVEVVKSAIETVNDSGLFAYLRLFEAEQIRLTVAQDTQFFSAKFELETKDENRAKTMGSGLQLLLKMAAEQAEKRNQKTSKDEAVILRGFGYPMVKEKTLILNFRLPKETVKEMVLRNLNKTEDNKTAGE